MTAPYFFNGQLDSKMGLERVVSMLHSIASIQFHANQGVFMMKTIHSLMLSGTVFGILLGLTPGVLQAANEAPIDMSAVQLEPQQQNGIAYLSGGIGLDESLAIKQTKGYNLHMTFSQGPGNEYLASIDVDIKTQGGRSVLSLKQVGPFVYVKLPAGKYLIAIGNDGNNQSRTVVVGEKSTRDVNFHWSDER